MRRPARRGGAVEDLLQEAGEVARVLVPRAVLVVRPLLTEELDAEGGDERDELLDESGVVELDDVDLEAPGEGARRFVGAVRQQREDEREAVDVPARGVQSEMRRVARLDAAADDAPNITSSISFLPDLIPAQKWLIKATKRVFSVSRIALATRGDTRLRPPRARGPRNASLGCPPLLGGGPPRRPLDDDVRIAKDTSGQYFVYARPV